MATFDAGTYYATKAKLSYSAVPTPDATSNSSFKDVQWLNTSNSSAVNGIPVGQSWLFNTACHKQIQQNSTTAGFTAASFSQRYVCSFPRDQALGDCADSGMTVGFQGCETSWCDGVTPLVLPDVCSNSDIFDPAALLATSAFSDLNQTIFTDLSFTNASSTFSFAVFATAVVMVQPDYSNAAITPALFSQTTPASTDSASSASTQGYWVGDSRKTVDRNAIEQDLAGLLLQAQSAKAAKAQAQTSYTYGSTAGATPTSAATASVKTSTSTLSASDSVVFAGCILPQQLRSACSMPGTCCDLLNLAYYDLTSQKCPETVLPATVNNPAAVSDWDILVNFGVNGIQSACYHQNCYTPADGVSLPGCSPCAAYKVETQLNANAAVFRPFSTYFTAVADANTLAACDFQEAVDSSGALVPSTSSLFNGSVLPPDSPDQTLFAYEPNCYEYIGYSGDARPKYGIRVRFSLLDSADGTDPTSSSWFSQFCQVCTPANINTSLSTQFASSYSGQAGWLALMQFYSRLENILGTSSAVKSTEQVYQAFYPAYFSYAVTQRYLLQFFGVAPPVTSLNYTTCAYLNFVDQTTWSASVAGVWANLASSATGDQATIASGLATSQLFTDLSRCKVTKVDDTNQVEVQICVPAILSNLLLTEGGASKLLQLMFPLTTAGNANFAIDQDLSIAEAHAFLVACSSSQTSSLMEGVFEVAEGSLSWKSYYVSESSNFLPAEFDATKPAGTQAFVAAVATFKVRVALHSLTLLFYLYYLSQVGEQITTMSNFVGMYEPQLSFAPEVLDWASACNLETNVLACSSSGYGGAGSGNLNDLFVNSSHQACLCINAKLASSAASLTSAVCFSNACRSSANMAIDRQSLLVNAASGSTCPKPARATITTDVNGGIISVDVDPDNRGSNYSSDYPPTVVVTGSLGSGAEFSVVLDSSQVSRVDVLNPGTNYDASTAEVYFKVSSSLPAATASQNMLTYNCATDCSAYANQLSTNLVTDYTTVDIAGLAATCNIELAAEPKGLSKFESFVIGSVLCGLSVPVCMLVALCVGLLKKEKSPSGKPKLLSKPVVVAGSVVAAIVGAGIAFFWLVFAGKQDCSAGTVTQNGNLLKASVCRSNPVKIMDFTLLDQFTLDQVFCMAPQSYCECDPQTNKSCSASSTCGCTDTATCCSDVGICASSSQIDMPYSNRQVTASIKETKLQVYDVVLCGSLFTCLVPAAITAFWLSTPWFGFGKVMTVGVILILCAAVCAVPMMLRAFDKDYYTSFDVKYMPCVALTNFPDVLWFSINSTDSSSSSSSSSSSDAQVLKLYSDNNELPSYYPDPLDTLNASSAASLVYVNNTWTLTDSQGLQYTNVYGSGVVFAPVSNSLSQTMYSQFKSGTVTLTACFTTGSGLPSCNA